LFEINGNYFNGFFIYVYWWNALLISGVVLWFYNVIILSCVDLKQLANVLHAVYSVIFPHESDR
jgi:cytochrome b subunit of formate dehydrogenase